MASLEKFLYESRPLLLIGIALIGFSHFGWNLGTFSGALLLTCGVMIFDWRTEYRTSSARKRLRTQRANRR